MEKFTTIVLAAGKGTRMKLPLPKVLHDLEGRPLIYYVLKELISLKNVCPQIIVVVGHKGKLIEETIKEEFPHQNLNFVYQKRLLGTADALRCAKLKAQHKNILILCADIPLITKETLSSFISFYLKGKCKPCLISAEREDENDLGRIVRDKKGIVCAVREKIDLTKADPHKEVNSGIYTLNRELLFKNLKKIKKNKKKKEFFLTDLVAILYNQNNPFASFRLRQSDEILGVNRPQDFLSISKILRKRTLDQLINKGVKIIDPETTFIAPSAKIGKNTVIFPFTFIEKNVIIGRNCSLGPFIHLRPAVIVLANTSLGNFLEISRSKIGKGVKIKHFGFIGDAQIQDYTNVGAGTVFANYDGKRKHKTFIGRRAFIGSDTVLVAPVKVGKGAMTGAGSVVNKDVKSKTVVVGVPAKFLKRIK